MVLLVIGNSQFSCFELMFEICNLFPFLVFRIICHRYLPLSLTLQEIAPGFQEEETKIQFDMTLIPRAKNSIVSSSPFLAKWQQTELWTKSTHVWCLADGREKKPHRKDCQWTKTSTYVLKWIFRQKLHYWRWLLGEHVYTALIHFSIVAEALFFLFLFF